MNRSSALTIVAVIALVGMAAVPMAASAATDPAVSVEQDPDTGDAVVTATDNGTTAENVTATVSSESAYEGTGTYDTDENGTLVLSEPNETVSVDVNASIDNTTASTQAELVPREDSLDVSAEQADDGSTTVTVTQYDEPVENATVEVDTGSDGEVVLPLPSENVTVEVTVTAGNETVTTTADLTVEFVQEEQPFGLAVSQFVSALQSATVDGPPGQVISEFVVSNNPGNAGDADDGNETADDGGSESANGNAPDDAGSDSDEEGDDADDENDSETANGDDAGDKSDESEASDEADEGDEDSGEQDDGNQGNGGNAGGSGGFGSAPGNSGNAPSRN